MSKRADPLWREFEKVVARIEADAAEAGLSVTSPDRIRCKITGRIREVDASIRQLKGDAELLTTIECRRRNTREDVTWIEQLATKRQSLGAISTIAVSSTGFSKSARKLAELHKIELKTLAEISENGLNSLLGLNLVLFWHRKSSPHSISVVYFREGEWEIPRQEDTNFQFPPSTNLTAQIFHNTDEGHRWSINDIWHQIQTVTDPFEHIEKGAAPVVRTACFPYPGNVTVDLPHGTYRLGDVILSFALWIEPEEVWLDDARKSEYGTSEGTSIQRVEFGPTQSPDKHISLQLPSKALSLDELRVGGNWFAEPPK